MAFEILPYTNFHDLNLDWILKQFPIVYEARDQAVQAGDAAVAAAAAAAESATSAGTSATEAEAAKVEAVAAKNNAAISADAAQAALESIGTATAGAVADWLAAHVDPDTGYVIDDTLSIKGAAADARAVGVAVSGLRNMWKENPTDLTWTNYRIQADGTLTSDAQYLATDPIPINGGIAVTVPDFNEDTPGFTPYNVYVALYAADDSFVSLSAAQTSGFAILADEGYTFRLMARYQTIANISPANAPFTQIVTLSPTDTDIRAVPYAGEAGKAADARATSEALLSIYNDITNLSQYVDSSVEQVKNLLPSVNTGELFTAVHPIMVPGYIQADGTIHSGDAYRTTSLITIPKGYQLVFTAWMASGGYYWAEYDSTGNTMIALGRKGMATTRSGIKIDAIDTRYVRLSTRITDVPVEAMGIYLVPLPDTPVSWDETSNIYHYDMSDPDHAAVSFTNQYVNASGNIVNQTGYRLSSVIYLQKGQTIHFKCAGSASAFLLSEWTFNTVFVSGIMAGNDRYHRVTYTADHDMYVRVGSRTAATIGSSLNKPYVTSSDFEDSINLYYTGIRYSDNPLYGKKIVVIGDSLIAGYQLGKDASWTRILEIESGATVYNYGINGNAISSVSGSSGTPMSKRINTTDIPEISTADIIVLEGGANDKNNNCPLGTISDLDTDSSTAENTTFYGAINKAINDMRAVNSHARILFMTTYHRADNTNRLGLSYKDYADAMITTCKNKSVPCYDNYSDSGMLFTDTNMSWIDEGSYLGTSRNNHLSPYAFEWLTTRYTHAIRKL